MSALAAIRPDEWNLPLLLHVFGAMLLMGGLVTATTALLLGWRRDSAPYTRLGFWSLLLVSFPAWWLMWIAGLWIYAEEDIPEENEPAWVGIGFLIAEGGGVLLLISIILTGIAVRRVRRPGARTSVLARIGGVLTSVLVLAYTVAVWAMTAKPD